MGVIEKIAKELLIRLSSADYPVRMINSDDKIDDVVTYLDVVGFKKSVEDSPDLDDWIITINLIGQTFVREDFNGFKCLELMEEKIKKLNELRNDLDDFSEKTNSLSAALFIEKIDSKSDDGINVFVVEFDLWVNDLFTNN